jgi:CRP/FNR family transcriptional regulator, anaerobic regulatory protein
MYPPEFLGFKTGDHHDFRCGSHRGSIMYLSKSTFLRLMHEIPQLTMKVLELAVRDLDFQREWSVTLGCKSSYEWVASLFYILARRATGDGTAVAFQLP